MYRVVFSEQAEDDFNKLKKHEPLAWRKALNFILELGEHPQTGTGKPKPLGGDRVGQWSRRITDKHRLIYSINDDVVEVFIISSYGHYDDK